MDALRTTSTASCARQLPINSTFWGGWGGKTRRIFKSDCQYILPAARFHAQKHLWSEWGLEVGAENTKWNHKKHTVQMAWRTSSQPLNLLENLELRVPARRTLDYGLFIHQIWFGTRAQTLGKWNRKKRKVTHLFPSRDYQVVFF